MLLLNRLPLKTSPLVIVSKALLSSELSRRKGVVGLLVRALGPVGNEEGIRAERIDRRKDVAQYPGIRQLQLNLFNSNLANLITEQ